MQIATDYNIEVLTISAMDESVSDSFAEVSSWGILCIYTYSEKKKDTKQKYHNFLSYDTYDSL